MAFVWNICFVASILFIIYKTTNAEIVKGSIDTSETWSFVARFCFLNDAGGFAYKITYPVSYKPQKLLLYYDEEDQWDQVYNNDDKTCEEKISPPHIITDRNQDITLDLGLVYHWSGCEQTEGSDVIECVSNRSFKSSRERWWYIAVSNCGDERGLKLDYEINMTNGPPSDLFVHHFSADKLTMLEQHLSFFLLFLVLSILSIVIAVLLNKKDFLHTTYKMYMVSLYVKTFSLLLLTIGYGKFAQIRDGDPKKLYTISCIARIINVMAHLVFLLMIILIGKGYTVTRGKLRLHTEILLTIFMAVYSVAILILYLVEFTLFDPGEVLYIYDFYFGIGLIILPIIGMIWLIYAVFFTLKHYPEKWKFYVPFTIVYGFWFLTLPIIVITSSYAIPVYMREKIVNGVELGISFLAYGVFLLLTLPCCTKHVFPFHVKTNKIDVMSNTPHTPASANVYAVSGNSNETASTTAAKNNMPPESTTYSVTRERLTIHNIPGSQLAPNLAALFVVSDTRSTEPPLYNNDKPPKYGDVVTEEA